VQSELTRWCPDGKKQLIPPRGLHSCLMTHVWVKKSTLPNAKDAIDEAVREFGRPLTVRLAGTKVIGKETAPVLVACLTEDSARDFKELASLIASKLRASGHVRGDSDYTPHMTIASASRDIRWGGAHYKKVLRGGRFSRDYRFGTQRVGSIALCTTKEKLTGHYTMRGNIQVLHEKQLRRE
jgi:2'-5' RNA ligase